MATVRTDIRTEVRDNIQEDSGITGAIWSDALLNRHIIREVRSLPFKNIYLEETWTIPQVVDKKEYAMPTKGVKLEKLEINYGTTALPDWQELRGWEQYGDTIHLPYTSTSTDSMRGHFRMSYVIPDADDTVLDIPEPIFELVVWGVTVRCYKILVGYLRGNKSWDSVTKPGDISVSTIQTWLRDATIYYKELIQQYATQPKTREIDLVS
jgi:hypothetical protein